MEMLGESLNITANNLAKLKELFPDVFTENQLDWEKLKATFSNDINFANERYVLNWAGKSDAFKVLQIPTTATLKPLPEESINFDTTQNVFIEGENLEVLKVLQKPYYGKIKCIIIDPPYNTGSDSFIYPDSFKENKADYEKRIGDKDEEGLLLKEGLFRKNSKDSGHFHSNWLSMMYPRLFLARNLLTDNGVIFVHIDDNEVHNLRLIMNEIFGEENFVASIVWQKSKKGDAKLIANIHEYILVFSKNKGVLIEAGNWRLKKEGADEVLEQYETFKKQFPQNHLLLSEAMTNWYKNLPKKDVRRNHSHYKYSDERGLYFAADFAGPDDGRKSRPRYDIIHPVTGKVCKKPSTGWRWDEKRTNVALNAKPSYIHFGPDETTIPCRKSYLKEINSEPFTSVFYKDGRTATIQVEQLLGKGVFSYPKDTEVLQKLISLASDENDIILDFFAGSGTLAQSIFELNSKEGKRKFILVQMPEPIEQTHEAYNAGYKTIADVSKERIRKVINKIKTETAEENKNLISELGFETQHSIIQAADLGFKSFKLSPSNFKLWRSNEINEENLVQQLDAFTNPVKDESIEQNMLYELMLKAGYSLTDAVKSNDKFYSIKDNELIIGLKEINQSVIDQVIAAKPLKVITLDKLFTGNDQLKTNTVLQMREAGIEFKTI